jgi:hypothetical protein
MSSKLPKATVAGIAAATPWKNRPKYTAIIDGTAATMAEEMQKTVAASTYIVRRPNTSEMGEQNMLPMVWPSKYLFSKRSAIV